MLASPHVLELPPQINLNFMKKTFAAILVVTALFSFACSKEAPKSKKIVLGDHVPTQPAPSTFEKDSLTELDMKTEPEKGDTVVVFDTNMGEIKALLYTEKAPETSKNFIELAKAGKYKGVTFHRVIEDFMIQGGDFENNNGTGGYSYKGPGTSIPDEFGPGLTHLRGAISMANAGPNTGGSQFFIVQAKEGTVYLDGKHAVFGFVYEGLDIVDKIAGAEADYNNKPREDIVIEGIEISEF